MYALKFSRSISCVEVELKIKAYDACSEEKILLRIVAFVPCMLVVDKGCLNWRLYINHILKFFEYQITPCVLINVNRKHFTIHDQPISYHVSVPFWAIKPMLLKALDMQLLFS
jgi:hypothetical protein